MLQLDAITLSVGGHDLLRDATLQLDPGQRLGLIGRNGCGKTTLLRAIAGELDLDAGDIRARSDVVLGYLPQQAVSGSTAPVWDEVSSRMTRHQLLADELEAAKTAVEEGRDGAIERLGRAEEAFRIGGGYAIEERIGEVLHGLGFTPQDWKRSCSEFSGGWQMRIALARLLLSEPSVLLLDEPTNHLDLHARAWLAGFLEKYPHAMIVVSHDRWLLDRIATHIAEVRSRRLDHFTGNLSAWYRERDLRTDQQQSEFTKQQGEIAKLERFVTRFKAKATKAAQARSRQKTLDRMDRIDAPEAEAKPRYRLPEAPGCSTEAVVLRDLTLGWPGGPDILSKVDVILERGMRLAVLGPNGAGKSTLLHAIAGRLQPRTGKRKLGQNVRIGVYDQDLAQELPADVTALDVVLAAAPAVLPARARAALGALGLPGDLALRETGALSGGEKARVVLATFAVKPYNVLLLDEPTNHLDTATVEVLAAALQEFEGAILLVSHDRWFVEQVATHVLHVSGGTTTLREGVRSEDFEPVRAVSTPDAPSDPASSDEPEKESYEERKRRQREREKAQRRADQLEELIMELEDEASALEDRMFASATDHELMAKLAKEQSDLRIKIAATYAEWEALESVIGG